jgi:signal transduction histidine kinase
MTARFLARLTGYFFDLWTDRRRRIGLILAACSVILMVLAAVLATTMALRVDNATEWVEHTYQVRALAGRAVIKLQDAEVQIRNPAAKSPGGAVPGSVDPRARFLTDITALRALVGDNPPQIERLAEIERLADATFGTPAPAASTQIPDPEAVLASIGEGDSATASGKIRDLFAAFDEAERTLLDARQARADNLQRLLLGLTLISLVFAAIASVAVVATSWSYIQDLRAQSAALQAEALSRREAETRLLQTQKIEMIGQLTAGIAHDFNNLLTIVLGNLDTVKRRIEQDGPSDLSRIARPVETALEGARRGATLTQKLLAFARQQPLAPAQLNLNKAVASMSDVLIRTVGESVKIETVLAAGLWPAFADPAHVDNAIVNLVVNARDAMPEGGRITLETANAELDPYYAAQFGDLAPGQYVLLSVSDTGAGIPRNILPRIFEPFFTTKDVGKGTGLGLAMIHGFVKQSKGHIRIYSEPGQGTTVKIYLPRATGAAAPVFTAPEMREAPDSSPPLARPGEVVLLVEDDEGVRDFARDALEGLGYTVLAGRDGAEGIAILKETRKVDVLFTDVVLPGGVNGRKLADEAARLRPRLPVLFTTGYTRNAIVHDGRLDPDVRLISKPYTQNMLAWTLRRILDESRHLV